MRADGARNLPALAALVVLVLVSAFVVGFIALVLGRRWGWIVSVVFLGLGLVAEAVPPFELLPERLAFQAIALGLLLSPPMRRYFRKRAPVSPARGAVIA